MVEYFLNSAKDRAERELTEILLETSPAQLLQEIFKGPELTGDPFKSVMESLDR